MIKINRLPSEYQEVEYIQSNPDVSYGYSDGPVLLMEAQPKDFDTIEADFSMTSIPSSNITALVGGRKTRAQGWTSWVAIRLNASGELRPWYGQEITTGFYPTVGTKYNVKVYAINGTQKVYVDGVQVGTGSITFDMETQNYMAIFGLYSETYDGRVNSCMPVKLYNIKFSKNGNVVYNLVPCYRKSDDVIGMYDTVNKVFYSKTGSRGYFTKSTKIEQPIVKKIMTKVNSSMKEIQYIKTKVNNNMVKVYDVLPNEYQRVEYISSNGGQYIDTGFTPDNNTSVEVKIKSSTDTNNGWVFGARQAADTKCFAVILHHANYNYNQTVRSDYGTSTPIQYNTGMNLQNNIITILKDKNIVYIDGVQRITHTSQTFTCPVNMYLFKINSANGGNHNSYTTMYYAKIWDNGTLIRNYVPCYRKSDNAIGMYDLVNDTFTAGVGTFTKGGNI